MSNLIRDYNDKQQKNYSSNLEVPKVVAPALQDAAPISDQQLNVQAPQGQPTLGQMTAPTPAPNLMPQYDVTAEFNSRLQRQLPTLLHGQPTDAERRSMEFYDWVGNQIEENRKRNAAQAIAIPSLMSQYSTPAQTRPSGFGSNVLKAIFGADETNVADDGVFGNEFDLKKGRFGQYGGGLLGGAMYFLDNTLGLGVLRNTVLDVGANLASQTAGWFAGGGIVDTLFKTGDVGRSIIAGADRQKQALRNIYGENPTAFWKQGLLGRDLGALGNLSGDADDDYKKMYGSSPAAAGLDKAFFGRSLTEQETKDYEKLTGYSIKQAAGLKFTEQEQQDYNEVLGRVPEDFKTKMLLRNLTGLVADIKTDDFLKPLIKMAPKAIPTPEVSVDLPRLTGAADSPQLGGSSVRGAFPPAEMRSDYADEYMVNWLRRDDVLETRPVKGTVGELPVGRTADPWVTIDAQAVRIPEALPSSSTTTSLVLPEATSSIASRTLTTPAVLPSSDTVRLALPSNDVMQDILKSVEAPAPSRSIENQVVSQLRTSSAKSLVVSPPQQVVTTPATLDLQQVLKQQYSRRVEPGQYILQRLGTIADIDPVIMSKAMEPAPIVQNPVRLLAPSKTPTLQDFGGDSVIKSFIKSEGATTTQFAAEDALVRAEIEAQVPSAEPVKVERVQKAQEPAAKVEESVVEKPQEATVEQPKPKMIPSSKEELLRQARENLAKRKAEESQHAATPPKAEEPTKVDVVEEAPKQVESAAQPSTKQQLLEQARQRLQQEKLSKAQDRLQAAINNDTAKVVEGGAEARVDLEKPEGQELITEAVDLHNLFNRTYDLAELDTMISMVSRKAAGAPVSFVGKVAPISEVGRSQKEIYRFASIVPHPDKAGKPLLPPTKSMVEEFRKTYGVDHPYASAAIADSSMKYLTKSGGARRHKSLADIAAEQWNPLYRKILSPGSSPIPVAVIEQFERQMAQGGQALVRTSVDTVAVVDTASTTTPQQQAKVWARKDAQAFIEQNKLGIKKNLSGDKLNEYLNLYESKGLDALPDEAFTKATLDARKKVTNVVETPKPEEVKREVKVEAAAAKVTKSETIEDFEESVVKLEELEPTLEELMAIEAKRSKAPIYDHRKKLASPSHTNAVELEAKAKPEIQQKIQRHDELTTQLNEVVNQEQELLKVKQTIDVAIDDVDARRQARIKSYMDKYAMTRDNAEEFTDVLEGMIARSDEVFSIVEEGKEYWQPSRKKQYKGIEQSEIDVNEVIRTAPNYEQLRAESIKSKEYEKAAAWLYENMADEAKRPTNPVIKIAEDSSIEFVSGRDTAMAAMDSGVEFIGVQIVSDRRLMYKEIEWMKHPLAKGERTKVSVADLDKRWKTDRVERGGEGGIGKRYQDALDFMNKNDKINMSEIVVKPDGSIVFKDGRHRFAALRDSGRKVISVMAENPQYLNAANVTPSKPTTNALEVVKQLDELPQEVKSEAITPQRPELLSVIEELDAATNSGNYLPIYELRNKLKGVSRDELDAALFELERNDLIELSALVEGSRYTREQYDAGIMMRTGTGSGSPLFFITRSGVAASNQPITTQRATSIETPKGVYTSKNANEDLLATSILGISDASMDKAAKRMSPLLENGVLNPTRFEEYLINKAKGSIASVFTLNQWGELTRFIAANSSNPARDLRTISDKFVEVTSRKDNPLLQGMKSFYASTSSANNAYKEGVAKVKTALNNSALVAETINLKKNDDVVFTPRESTETTPNGMLLDNFTQNMRIENNTLMFSETNTNQQIPIVTTNSRESFVEAFKNFTVEALPNRSLEDDGSIRLLQLFGVKNDQAQGFDGRWLEINDLQTASGDVIFTPYRNGGSLYRFINAYLRSGISGIADMVESYNLEAMLAKGKSSGDAKLKWDDAGLRRATIDAIYYVPLLRKALSEMPVYDAVKYKTDTVMKSRLLNPQAPNSIVTRKDNKLVRGLPLRFVADLKKGSTFVDEAFISTTINYEHAINFAKSMLGSSTANPEQGAIIVFNTSKNAHITPNRLENEVLFAPGNKFVVDDIKTEKGLPTYYVSQVDQDLTLGSDTYINLETGESYVPQIHREPLSRQNISDALNLARNVKGTGVIDEVVANVAPSELLRTAKRRNPDAAAPTTVGQAVREFKEALQEVNRTGILNDRTQIKLNNAVYAMESYKDKSYAAKMREVVARMTGRGTDEGKPFMSAAVDILNDDSRNLSRDEIADVLSYAIGAKTVKFDANIKDDEILRFARFVAQRPETMSQFDHVYIGHGTGIVEHGTWSLTPRKSQGETKARLIQHVIDDTYPKGTEVGVAACETGCPKRIQDAVPPMHRVVSRGAVQNAMEDLQRLIEGLSSMTTTPKVMDVLAQYDGMLREALSANKERGTEILMEMSKLEDEFNDITRRKKFANEQITRSKLEAAQRAMEKEFLGDC